MKLGFSVAFVLCATSAVSQIRQIDNAKLPQEIAVQGIYSDLLPIEPFARTYEAKWRFPVPKEEVASRFRLALHILEEAQKHSPSNEELQVFTGLVAHLGYNLDIEEAYDPAVKLLEARAADDFRASWFLGIHQCQSNNSVGGMQRLLRVETSSKSRLPGAFWQDYANCASVTNMPVHAVRAYDNAQKIPDGLPVDEQLEQIARNRIKAASPTASYTAKQIWYAAPMGDRVRFISDACGESFSVKPTSPVQIADVKNGTCSVVIDTDKYPSGHSSASASLLLLTQVAKKEESLETYAERMLKNPRYVNKMPLKGVECPVETCLAFEIVTDKLYSSEGGAHLIALFFSSNEPDYPGLRFEVPHPLPKPSQDSKSTEPSFFRADETIQRFKGTLFTFVALDANQAIYSRSRVDFDELLKSLVVDTK